jgi:hypothetical protein
MKTSKAGITMILLMATSGLFAQSGKQFLDTVKIMCNNQVQVKIAVYDHMSLRKDTLLPVIISDMQRSLHNLKATLPEGSYKITYKHGLSLVVEKLPAVSKYLISGDSVIPFRQRNECEVMEENFHIFFQFGAIHELLDPEINPCISSTISQMPGRNRYAGTFSYQYAKGFGKPESSPFKNPNSMDMLNISAGIGAGLVKNTLVTDIGLEIGFNFNKKGIIRNGYYLSDNFMYIFNNQTDHFAVNNFLNVGYRYNLSNDPGKKDWLGPEIGFPVHKEGLFFRDNIFRAGIRWDIGNSIFITGQLYVNDRFKSAYPGLRIGFWF